MGNEIDTSVLDPNGNDLLKSLVSGVFGCIPIPGVSVISEIITNVIPNQRMDRVANCLREVCKLAEKNEYKIEDLMRIVKNDKNNLLLFEEMIRYSAVTESDVKHHSYAYFVFHILSKKDKSDINDEAILKTISELNEYEILDLIGIKEVENPNSEFVEKYKEYILCNAKEYEEDSFNAFLESYLNNLIVKGLAVAKDDIKKGVSSLYLSNYGKIICDVIFDEEYFIYRNLR